MMVINSKNQLMICLAHACVAIVAALTGELSALSAYVSTYLW